MAQAIVEEVPNSPQIDVPPDVSTEEFDIGEEINSLYSSDKVVSASDDSDEDIIYL